MQNQQPTPPPFGSRSAETAATSATSASLRRLLYDWADFERFTRLYDELVPHVMLGIHVRIVRVLERLDRP